MVKAHVLGVLDEMADIEAAAGWQAGEPAAGQPYEAGADTSKNAAGRMLGQAEFRDEPLRVLS